MGCSGITVCSRMLVKDRWFTLARLSAPFLNAPKRHVFTLVNAVLLRVPRQTRTDDGCFGTEGRQASVSFRRFRGLKRRLDVVHPSSPPPPA